MIMKTKVFVTKTSDNYEMFHLLPMNRIIDGKVVELIVRSIRSMGVFRPVVCIKTDVLDGILRTYVLDGQHLLRACEREGIAVPYVYVEIEEELDIVNKMAFMNSSSKSWVLKDYVNAWRYYLADYGKLKKYTEIYNLEVLMVSQICNDVRGAGNMAGGSASIKTGEFKITNPNAEEMCKLFSDLFIAIGRADRWVKHQFLYVFLQAYGPKYDHDKTLKNIKKHMAQIKIMSDVDKANEYIQKKVFNLI
jgi:hypothetical protein